MDKALELLRLALSQYTFSEFANVFLSLWGWDGGGQETFKISLFILLLFLINKF